jgi:hypothetical protein
VLYDHLGNVMDASWWSAQWGANEVDIIFPLPLWPPFLPTPYDPGDKKPAGRLIFGGGGKVGDAGGVALGDPVPAPEVDRYFDVSIPSAISNGNPFNVTVTARNPDGTTDTSFTGPVTVLLSAWGTGAVSKTFTQNTAPSAVSWTNGVTTISCTVTATARELEAISGLWMRVKAIYGEDGRGPIQGESDRAWLTAVGYLQVVASVTTVQTGVNFTLTVTAYNADGTVNTSFASACTISENSTALSLTDLAIASGDWVNGVATITEQFTGSITSAEDVTINVQETASGTPAGEDVVEVTPNPTVYKVTQVTTYCYVGNGDGTPHPNLALLQPENSVDGAGAVAERQVLLRLANSVDASKVIGAIISADMNAQLAGLAGGLVYMVLANGFNAGFDEPRLEVAISAITADFDPTTVVWATKPAATLIAKVYPLVLRIWPNPPVANDSYTFEVESGAPDLWDWPAVAGTVYGLQVSCKWDSGGSRGDLPSDQGGQQYAHATLFNIGQPTYVRVLEES